MATLVPIWGTPSETINARHAPSIEAAFKELYKASGIVPIVSQGGGSRTLAEAIAVGTGAASDHYQDNAKGRAAVDINNQRTFRNWNEPVFEATLAKWGWRNITIDGVPFPSEPWHFANHDIIPAALDIKPFTVGGPPMFGLVADPGAGLVFVVGITGRLEGVQSAPHLQALLDYREATQKSGTKFSDITNVRYGDFVGARGAISWYLNRVNGNPVVRAVAGKAKVAAAVFTPEEIAAVNEPRTTT